MPHKHSPAKLQARLARHRASRNILRRCNQKDSGSACTEVGSSSDATSSTSSAWSPRKEDSGSDNFHLETVEHPFSSLSFLQDVPTPARRSQQTPESNAPEPPRLSSREQLQAQGVAQLRSSRRKRNASPVRPLPSGPSSGSPLANTRAESSLTSPVSEPRSTAGFVSPLTHMTGFREPGIAPQSPPSPMPAMPMYTPATTQSAMMPASGHRPPLSLPGVSCAETLPTILGCRMPPVSMLPTPSATGLPPFPSFIPFPMVASPLAGGTVPMRSPSSWLTATQAASHTPQEMAPLPHPTTHCTANVNTHSPVPLWLMSALLPSVLALPPSPQADDNSPTQSTELDKLMSPFMPVGYLLDKVSLAIQLRAAVPCCYED